MRGRYVLAGGICACPVVLTCCADILGVPSDSFLRDAAAPETAADGPPPPEPPDAGCPPGTKACDGTCVANDKPEYGCDAPGCSPCALPFASSVKCEAGRCAAATCAPGHMHCSGTPEDGCEASNLSPMTCGGCTVACDSSQVCGPGGPGQAIQCLAACPGTTTNCSGSCVDLTSDADHCSACDRTCPGAANADPSCKASTCTIACHANYADCDSNPANGCEPLVVFYKDGDGDGYGVTESTMTGCTAPVGYAKQGGDCADNEPDVFPGQPKYFGTGYTNANGDTSYDYDCSGTETEAPGFVHFNGCDSSCTLSGYSKTAPRNGVNIDLFCGSTQGFGCSSGATSGSCNTSSKAFSALTCR